MNQFADVNIAFFQSGKFSINRMQEHVANVLAAEGYSVQPNAIELFCDRGEFSYSAVAVYSALTIDAYADEEDFYSHGEEGTVSGVIITR